MRLAWSFALALLVLAPAAGADTPRPTPIVKPQTLDLCSAASVQAAMNAAAVDPTVTDHAGAVESAFRTRVESCVATRLAWASTSTTGPTTWTRAKSTISDYLYLLWKGGVLQGTKPEAAYYAKCDRTTMTQKDIDSGLLLCVYGAAVIKPAEFETMKVRIQTTGSGS
jgi:phage tail sheath protein FI